MDIQIMDRVDMIINLEIWYSTPYQVVLNLKNFEEYA